MFLDMALAMVAPMVARVFVFLGIGWVTYQSVTFLVNSVRDNVVGLWNGIPVAALQLITLGGFSQAVGILLGALAARAVLVAVDKIGKVAT